MPGGFPHLIADIALSAGGSIIKFAGDAVLACWVPPDSATAGDSTGSSAAASVETLRAAICCLELLIAMRGGLEVDLGSVMKRVGGGYDSGGSDAPLTVSLKIHIGVGVGRMCQVHIGGGGGGGGEGVAGGRLGRREFFIAGEAVVEAGDMLGLAKSGEVAFPPSSRAFLRNTLDRVNPALLETATLSSAPVVIADAGMQVEDLAAELRAVYAGLAGERLNESVGDGEGSVDEPPAPGSDPFAILVSYVDESLAYHLLKSNHSHLARKTITSANRDAVPAVTRKTTNTSSIAVAGAPRNSLLAVSQLRNVSVVFVRLPALKVPRMGEPAMLALAQKVFTAIMEVLGNYNGCLRQFACDDKSASALIVFGLAGFAHERGEEPVAVLAAWDIATRLRRLAGGDFSIGVASGIVFYGIVGNESRSDGTCMGTAVNLAARIMTHPCAMGRVVCDEGTYLKAEDEFAFERLPEILFKGSSAPAKLFAPTSKAFNFSRELDAETPSTLFGRDAETVMLGGLVDAWLEGAQRRMLLSLEMELADRDFLTDLRPADRQSIVNASHKLAPHIINNNSTNNSTYSVGIGRRASGSFLSMATGDSATRSGGLTKTFIKFGVPKDRVRLLYKAMPVLEHIGPEDVPEAKTANEADLLPIVKTSIVKVLNKLAVTHGMKIVLFFDDMQWMDSNTVDVVLELMSKCTNVLVVVLTRPLEEIKQTMKARLESLLNAPQATVIALQPLDKLSAIELMRNELKDVLAQGVIIGDDIYDKVFSFGQGQYFQLIVLADVLSRLGLFADQDFSASEISELISSRDTFKFIVFLDDSGLNCSFSHFLIQQGVLKSLVPSFTARVHLAFADFFESILAGSNIQTTLPSLLHHLMDVPASEEIDERQKKHLRAAFIMAAKMYRPLEGFEYLQKLEELQAKTPDAAFNIADQLEQNQYTTYMLLEMREAAAVHEIYKNSMSQVGFPFPKSTRELLFLLLKLCSLFLKFIKSSPTQRLKLSRKFMKFCMPVLHQRYPDAFRTSRRKVSDDNAKKALDQLLDALTHTTSVALYMAISNSNLNAPTIFLTALVRGLVYIVGTEDFPYVVASVSSQLILACFYNLPLYSKMIERRIAGLLRPTPSLDEIAKLTPSELEAFRTYSMAAIVVAVLQCDWEDSQNFQRAALFVLRTTQMETSEVTEENREGQTIVAIVTGKVQGAEAELRACVAEMSEADVGVKTLAEMHVMLAALLVDRGGDNESVSASLYSTHVKNVEIAETIEASESISQNASVMVCFRLRIEVCLAFLADTSSNERKTFCTLADETLHLLEKCATKWNKIYLQTAAVVTSLLIGPFILDYLLLQPVDQGGSPAKDSIKNLMQILLAVIAKLKRSRLHNHSRDICQAISGFANGNHAEGFRMMTKALEDKRSRRWMPDVYRQKLRARVIRMKLLTMVDAGGRWRIEIGELQRYFVEVQLPWEAKLPDSPKSFYKVCTDVAAMNALKLVPHAVRPWLAVERGINWFDEPSVTKSFDGAVVALIDMASHDILAAWV
ncbi:Adenylate cyclase type 10 [Irineochytrium annulatum]|nr:Adenylate cyclase type 10 [Irineochytrium annulatum]